MNYTLSWTSTYRSFFCNFKIIEFFFICHNFQVRRLRKKLFLILNTTRRRRNLSRCLNKWTQIKIIIFNLVNLNSMCCVLWGITLFQYLCLRLKILLKAENLQFSGSILKNQTNINKSNEFLFTIIWSMILPLNNFRNIITFIVCFLIYDFFGYLGLQKFNTEHWSLH